MFIGWFIGLNSDLTGLNTHLNSQIRSYYDTPTSLVNFIQNTSFVGTWVHFRIRDTNAVLGLGVNWIRGYIQYQNAPSSGYDVDGQGIVFTNSTSRPFFIQVNGNSSSGYNVTHKEIIDPTLSVIDTNTLKVTKNNNTVIASFVNTGIKNGDNLGQAMGGYKPLKITCAIVADNLSNTTKIIELYTNGTCAVYNTDFTSYTAPISAVGELIFHI